MSDCLSAFAKSMSATTSPTATGILDWGNMLLAIRKDSGHGDRKLDKRDLLRITITDVDQHLGAGAKL